MIVIPGVRLSDFQLIVKQTHSKPGEEIRKKKEKKNHSIFNYAPRLQKTTIFTFFFLLDVILRTDSPDSKQQSVRLLHRLFCGSV